MGYNIFTVLGIQQTSGGYTAGDISNYITELNGEFHLGAVTLIPAILIIVLLLCKVNAISALGISSFAAGAVSFFVQHATLQSIIQTAYSGYTTTIEEGVLQSILNRGGILYTSAYRPHCRISRPHFYPVGIRASGSTQSIWP